MKNEIILVSRNLWNIFFFGITRIGSIIKLARLWSKHLWYFITQRLKPRRLSGRVPISCVLYRELFFNLELLKKLLAAFYRIFEEIFFSGILIGIFEEQPKTHWNTFSGDISDQLKWPNFLWELKKFYCLKFMDWLLDS